MTFDRDKTAIIDALRHGYERGVLLPGETRPAYFDAEGAWSAVRGAMSNIKRLSASGLPIRTGKRGRPVGRPTEDPVALLAPIYRRYTGARATVSHPNAKKIALLIAYAGKEVRPKRRNPNRAFGPFASFVMTVMAACDLPIPGADTIDKVTDILRGDNEDRSGRSEAQSRFKSTYRTAEETFSGYLSTLRRRHSKT